MGNFKLLLIVLAMGLLSLAITPAEMDKQISAFVSNNSIMGIALQITKGGATVYRANQGYRDWDRKLLVDNSTAFRVASLSKSMSSCGLLLLVEQNKLKLSDSINSLLGFDVVNPNFPTKSITVEMLLSHQSSLLDCVAYDYFLTDTDIASSGTDVPKLRDLLVSGGKYYNTCLFANKTPGTYFTYTNMNYVIMGTIIEKLTNTRFDVWMKQNLLSKIGSLSYNPADLPVPNNLAALYTGLNGKWLAVKDNFNGTIPQRNLTGYIPGTNAGIYGPQAFVRATTDELLKYINMIRNKGLLNGTQVLKTTSVADLVRPRYEYHGEAGGSYDDMHAYGLGIASFGYYPNDNVLKNKFTVGHTGSGYGLISAYYYSGDWAFSFVINGILNGYTYNNDSIYQVERQWVNALVDRFVTEASVGEETVI